LLFVLFYASCAGEIVLFERGNYAALPDIALFERLMNRPQHFALRRCRADGARKLVYERVATRLAPRALQQPVQPALLAATLPLLRLGRSLPEYTLTTRQLNDDAQRIRAALREARAPDELLFERLPAACGLPPFTADATGDEATVDAFFAALRSGLEALQQAYPTLLLRIQDQVRRAFRVDADDGPTIRAELLDRYQRIADITNDPQIRALGVRLETSDDAEASIESIAALIAKRPPAQWGDSDLPAFEATLNDLGRRFMAVEQLAPVTQQEEPAQSVLRIGIMNQHGETSRVVRQRDHSAAAGHFRAELQTVLDRYQHLSADERTMILTELLAPLLDMQLEIERE
jgi:hypothetical protein